MKSFTRVVAGLALFVVASVASAGNILIINGATGTSEPGTTANNTANLSQLHMDVGNTVTVSDGVPVDLSAYDQVWDIRFSNNQPITGAVEAQYLGFLQAGGGMFVMGENSSFPTRNDSVISLFAATGAGTFVFDAPSQPETVFAPFNGPNPIIGDMIQFAAPGGVMDPGTCQFMTQGADGSGTGVACGVGDMANALAGALTVVFDVNFMEGTRGENQQNFLKNLIGFVGDEVDPPVDTPEPGSLALLGLGLAGLGFARRKKNL